MIGIGQLQQPTTSESKLPPRRGWLYACSAICLCLCVLLGIVTYQKLYRPVHLKTPQVVIIGKGATLSFVAKRLQERGLIPSAYAFQIYAHVTRQANQLKIGEYEIRDGSRPIDILAILISGRARSVMLTIPEGKWASEIGKIVETRWPETASDFSQLIGQPQRWQGKVPFPLPETTLEGYLFPDTYCFSKNVTAETIVGKMLERFQVTCWAAYKENPPTDGRSFQDVLVLASLVEAEAKVDAERPIIAGVYMNRLQAHWTLDCDATLIYPLQERVKRVLNKDKMIDSPYNTYRRQGLPPGPINNPGLLSFKAALHPTKVPYFFYVARGDGSHIFSRTLAEQNKVIRRIRGK